MDVTTTPLTTAPALDAPMPLARVLRAYAIEIAYESLRILRSPGFAVPFLLLPVPLYLFFGVMLASAQIAKTPGIANYLFSSWLAFTTMGPALFGVGCTLAIERQAGYLTLKRAQPAPGGAYLVAKMAMAMVLAAVGIAAVTATALLAGKITLSGTQLLVMAMTMIVGTLPFSAIGLFVGAHVSGNVAPAVINIVFLPMIWLSGLFFPLPAFLEPWVLIWPAFHLNQLALGAAGVTDYIFVPISLCAAVLTGLTVLFGGLAIQRLARKG